MMSAMNLCLSACSSDEEVAQVLAGHYDLICQTVVYEGSVWNYLKLRSYIAETAPTQLISLLKQYTASRHIPLIEDK